MTLDREKVDALVSWYRMNKRILPFRDTGDPFDVWISEIMLQQTRIDAVISYFLRFKEHLDNSNVQCYGVQDVFLSREELISNSTTGWQSIIGVGAEVSQFLDKYVGGNKTILANNIRRGTMGNSGNTALTVMPKHHIHPYIPQEWLIGAINNAKELPKIITKENAPDTSFILPKDDQASKIQVKLQEIVASYLAEANGILSTKKQKTAKKSPEDIISDICKDQKTPSVNAILIPRGCREIAKLSIIANDPILVSTNFLTISVEEKKMRFLIASWLKSIFGQLQLELFATSQEGMRKLEKNTILRIRFPNMEAISVIHAQKLSDLFEQEPFLDLSHIEPRESDSIWARILISSAKDNNHKMEIGDSEVKEMVDAVVMMLQEEYDNRVQ